MCVEFSIKKELLSEFVIICPISDVLVDFCFQIWHVSATVYLYFNKKTLYSQFQIVSFGYFIFIYDLI